MPDESALRTVIIISFNTRELTLRCLNAIYAEANGFLHEVIVVDNASEDASVDAINRAFPQTRVIVNERNLGFARPITKRFARLREDISFF